MTAVGSPWPPGTEPANAAPGLQYVAVSAGGTLHEHATGWADLAERRPMDLGTTVMAYSMSKTVTAIATLQLAEAGALRLDDPLDTWVPSQPYGAGVTVRQLLAHVAGVPAPIPLRWVHPRAEHDTFDEAAALAAVLRAHPRPAGPPGRRYRYSNIGYWLLGAVVERASGTPFPERVRAHVLEPLGLAPAQLGYGIVDGARHAAGYLERWSLLNLARRFLVDPALVGETLGRWVRLRDHYVNGPAFGGLVGTARAFGRLLRDLLAPHSVLLDAPTRRLLAEPQHRSDGREVPMTLGWHLARRGSRRVLFKEGGGGGFRCMMRLYPDDGIGTVLMTNATSPDVGHMLDRLDAPFLTHRGAAAPAGPSQR
jgi:CubicO group peptidase (beta-lactamase class C family)